MSRAGEIVGIGQKDTIIGTTRAALGLHLASGQQRKEQSRNQLILGFAVVWLEGDPFHRLGQLLFFFRGSRRGLLRDCFVDKACSPFRMPRFGSLTLQFIACLHACVGAT